MARTSGWSIRLEHPAYARPLFIIYHHHGLWTAYQHLQLVQHLRKLERHWRRAEEDRRR